VGNTTRLFFATDIHASTRCFKKFLNAAKHYGADVLVLGGDVTGKRWIHITMEGSGRGTAIYDNGRKVRLETRADIARLEEREADAGTYVHRCTLEEHERLQRDANAQETLFYSLMEARIREWVGLADERLRHQDVRVFFNAGNDDIFAIDSLIDSSATMVRPEGKCVEIDDSCTMISTGFANMTPFRCPRDISEDELACKIASMIPKVPDLARCIFNFHCPPYQSKLDNAAKVGPDLQPRMTAFGIEMAPAGSTAVRAAIEQHQPLLGLHGHIHESKGATRIGRTPCLNPGSEYHEGVLRGALIELNRGAIKNYAFTCG
jgi:Icc-related predicted phosphoesterase